MNKETEQSALQAHYSSLDRAWKKYKENDDLEARDFILESYTPLVKGTARRIYTKRPWIFDLADLEQAGMIGLFNAVERFEPARKVLFGTYANMRIVGAIYDEINSMDWTPRAMRQKIRKTLLAIQKIEKDGKTKPSHEDVAKAAGIPIEDVAIALRHAPMTHVSAMDQDTVGAMETGMSTRFVSSASAEASNMGTTVERIHQRIELSRALSSFCTKDEANVLALHFYEEKTLKQVGEELGFSSSKVSSLKRRALNKLADVMNKGDWNL